MWLCVGGWLVTSLSFFWVCVCVCVCLPLPLCHIDQLPRSVGSSVVLVACLLSSSSSSRLVLSLSAAVGGWICRWTWIVDKTFDVNGTTEWKFIFRVRVQDDCEYVLCCIPKHESVVFYLFSQLNGKSVDGPAPRLWITSRSLRPPAVGV